MDTWNDRMTQLLESASYLNSLNVLEVQFANGEWLDLYIAATQRERAQGLSNLEAIDVDGMLFYYDKPSFVPFTMSAMKMDLSIAWYDIDGKLLRHGTYKAGSDSPLFSSTAFSYVIETPAGLLPECNINLKERNG